MQQQAQPRFGRGVHADPQKLKSFPCTDDAADLVLGFQIFAQLAERYKRNPIPSEVPIVRADEVVAGNHQILHGQGCGQVEPGPCRRRHRDAVDDGPLTCVEPPLMADGVPAAGGRRPRRPGEVDSGLVLQPPRDGDAQEERGSGVADRAERRQRCIGCDGVEQGLRAQGRSANPPALGHQVSGAAPRPGNAGRGGFRGGEGPTGEVHRERSWWAHVPDCCASADVRDGYPQRRRQPGPGWCRRSARWVSGPPLIKHLWLANLGNGSHRCLISGRGRRRPVDCRRLHWIS